MSVNKLMSRIVSPTNFQYDAETSIEEMASKLHQQSCGIVTDPLTQFACIFSALIHDVDHAGVPNAQLIKENHELGAMYDNKSVAEQVSVDVAWNLLMEQRYGRLRAAICASDLELRRFRELVVNSLMATDILTRS